MSFQAFFEAATPSSHQAQALNPPIQRWICQQCRKRSTRLATLIADTRPGFQISKLPGLKINRHNQIRFFSKSSRQNAELSSKNSSDHELPSKQEFRRSKTSRQLSHMMDNIQANIFVAGQRLNDLTGYSAIEALKKEIEGQGQQILSQIDKPANGKQKL